MEVWGLDAILDVAYEGALWSVFLFLSFLGGFLFFWSVSFLLWLVFLFFSGRFVVSFFSSMFVFYFLLINMSFHFRLYLLSMSRYPGGCYLYLCQLLTVN